MRRRRRKKEKSERKRECKYMCLLARVSVGGGKCMCVVMGVCVLIKYFVKDCGKCVRVKNLQRR